MICPGSWKRKRAHHKRPRVLWVAPEHRGPAMDLEANKNEWRTAGLVYARHGAYLAALYADEDGGLPASGGTHAGKQDFSDRWPRAHRWNRELVDRLPRL